MRSNHSIALHTIVLVILVMGLSRLVWAQGGESPIYNFGNDASQGVEPASTLVVDRQGNLFGTTVLSRNGTSNNGTVFEITPLGAGTWALSNYYVFTGGADGGYPTGGLVLDSAGNIYGTAASGGDPSCKCGTVFELTPANGGGWTFSVLHSFDNSRGDAGPWGRLAIDKNGNLFGTTRGTFTGAAFELKRTKKGWTYTVLGDTNGNPRSGLLIGKGGVLYGTSVQKGAGTCVDSGGTNVGCGFVFQFKRTKGVWNESVLYNFVGAPNDGNWPQGELIADASGKIYGTTASGGGGTCPGNTYPGSGCGTLYQLSHSKSGWREQILHNFVGGTNDGAFPIAGPVFDGSGELLGTAFEGGINGDGVIYKWRTAPPNWTISSFLGGTDGIWPVGGMAFDSAGFLYGTTARGGVYGQGTVFTLIP